MSNKQKKGNLFIVSAPSGAGKTTLCQTVLTRIKGIVPSISYTSRPRRGEEVNGRDYYFVTEETFKHMIEKSRFAEWAIVHGCYYGTDRKFLEEKINAGIDLLFNIDVQGAEQLVRHYPDAITVFIHPPSFEELKKRLIQRRSDSEESIEKRLQEARKELQASESYQFHIINDRVEKATAKLIKVIESQRRKK